MSARQLPLSQTLLKFLFVIGLMVTLFVLSRQPFSLLSKLIIWISPYRKQLPYIMAQAKHETGNFTSSIFRTHNNLFGMKHARIRRQVGERGDPAPEKDGTFYQRYISPFQSVQDYLLYLDAVKFPTTSLDSQMFVDQLASRGYFGKNPTTTARQIYLGGVNRYLA